MHIKRNLALATLAAMVGVPTMGTINANASGVQLHGNTPTTSDSSNVHITKHDNHEFEYRTDNDSQKQITGYGSLFKHQMNDLNQNNLTQYSNNDSLPKTNELDNRAKSIVGSILLSATGTATAATALKEHERQRNVTNTHSKSNNKHDSLNSILKHIKQETNKLNGYIANSNNQ